jgi:hypothetical protein
MEGGSLWTGMTGSLSSGRGGSLWSGAGGLICPEKVVLFMRYLHTM